MMKQTGVKITGIRFFDRSGDNDHDFVVFDIADILFIELARPSKNAPKQPLFHTEHGAYFPIGTLEGLEIVLAPYGITPLDNVNLVQLDKIDYLAESKYFLRVYFANGEYTSVSKANLHKIKHIQKRTIQD